MWKIMKKQIFLHWPHLLAKEKTSRVLVLWFWRVLICELNDVDIPRLTLDGIEFAWSFQYTRSLQYSSTLFSFFWLFDATALGAFIQDSCCYLPLDMSAIVSQGLSNLIIQSGCYGKLVNSSFKLTGVAKLKRIVIGKKCFKGIRKFELDGLNELESIAFGNNSFASNCDEYDDEPLNGDYRVINCPKLKTIQIGCYTFTYYTSFELNNLPSLQSIQIDDHCFINSLQFSLTGLTEWLFMIHRSSSAADSEAWW